MKKLSRGPARSQIRLGILILTSGILVPLAIALSDSKGVLLGAVIGVILYQWRWRRPVDKDWLSNHPSDSDL